MPRNRHFFTLLLSAASAFAAYPDKSIRVVIDFPAGGTVGAQDVMKAPADGYTLMLANTGVMVINPALYNKLPYNTLKEFIVYAKSKPGQINYSSAGNGGISHLVPEMFKSTTGLFMVHIPYRGSAPAFTDLMAGQVQFMAESIPQAANYHRQQKVRALAVTSKERNPALPDVPTVIKAGINGFEVVGFYGFLAPAGLPKDITAELSDAFKQVMTTADVRTRKVTQGADPAFVDSNEFTQFLASETPRWAQAVKTSGAKLD